MTNENRELSLDQLQCISGGMKWTRGHVSPNVIDARGGMVTVLGWTFTIDIKGNVSSVTH
jgi:hypothetical protein